MRLDEKGNTIEDLAYPRICFSCSEKKPAAKKVITKLLAKTVFPKKKARAKASRSSSSPKSNNSNSSSNKASLKRNAKDKEEDTDSDYNDDDDNDSDVLEAEIVENDESDTSGEEDVFQSRWRCWCI
jgi:hypothetical protein